MKKTQKRLVLDRETLRHLRQAELVLVVGGDSGSCLRSCVNVCHTDELSECVDCQPL